MHNDKKSHTKAAKLVNTIDTCKKQKKKKSNALNAGGIKNLGFQNMAFWT